MNSNKVIFNAYCFIDGDGIASMPFFQGNDLLASQVAKKTFDSIGNFMKYKLYRIGQWIPSEAQFIPQDKEFIDIDVVISSAMIESGVDMSESIKNGDVD